MKPIIPQIDIIELIVFDFDGVMTDNKVMISQTGEEFVTVNRADGLGISMLKAKGLKMLILSTEVNKVVSARATKLGLPVLHGIEKKEDVLQNYCRENGMNIDNIIYVGNDVNDLPAMKKAGFCIAPADAHERIKEVADITLEAMGGNGVVREIAGLILQEQPRLEISDCYLCGSSSLTQRPGVVRDDDRLRVLECRDCGLVFLSSFSHIDEEFYEKSGMHDGTPNIENWIEETSEDDQRRYHFLEDMVQGKRILDFGCGTGGFLIRAKVKAAYAAGVEKESQFKEHFIKKGLNVYSDISEVDDKFDIITMFHVLEHVPDPVECLKTVQSRLTDDGILIIEVPNSNDALLTLYNCEPFSRFTYWKCHLFLFNNETLQEITRKAGLETVFSTQVQRYPLSNHLFWLAKGKPGGHKAWSFLDSESMNCLYEESLRKMEFCDTIIAGFKKSL